MEKSIFISKLDAAKRQLETVIRLYFSNGDPVSIHTLTAAAYNVIRDVNEKSGGIPMLVKDQMVEYVKPEYQKMFRDKINESENFFKHADRNHKSTIDFNPDQSEILIYDACSQYYKLTGEFPPLFYIYQGWFRVNKQEFFNLPEEQKRLFATSVTPVLELGRMGYFNMMLPLVMRIRV